MTESERRLWVEKCAQVLHYVLVEIRSLTYQDGQAKRVNDLTDLTHNIPLFMAGRDDYVLGYLREGFVEYARKYQPEIAPDKSRYVMILDMDEATFANLHRRTSWPWPETSAAVG